jgi:hypothetical protein
MSMFRGLVAGAAEDVGTVRAPTESFTSSRTLPSAVGDVFTVDVSVEVATLVGTCAATLAETTPSVLFSTD